MSEDPAEAQAILAKHRNGETGKIALYFSGAQTKFIDIANSTYGFSTIVESKMNADSPRMEPGQTRTGASDQSPQGRFDFRTDFDSSDF